MDVSERESGDLELLVRLARRERDADRRDRYRAVAAALDGQTAPAIAGVLGRSRRQVQDWVYAYRNGGIEAIQPAKRPGKAPTISGEKAQRLAARLDAGPTAGDKVCALRGKDVQRIVREELGVDLSVSAVYATLHRMGYSCLAPRPRHENHDPVAQKTFREKSAPFF